jgi:hypothetical protein
MKVKSGMWKSVLVSGVVIGSSAAVTFGTLSALGVTFGGGGEAQEVQDVATATAGAPSDAPSVLVHSALQVSNRDRPAVCVDAVDTEETLETIAASVVEAALPALVEHPTWDRTDYATKPPTIVEQGCPTGPALYSADNSNVSNLFEVRSRFVVTASYYRLHMFVVSTEEMNRLGGREAFRFSSEESVCSDDGCVPVTQGIYVSEEDLADQAFITNLLIRALFG